MVFTITVFLCLMFVGLAGKHFIDKEIISSEQLEREISSLTQERKAYLVDALKQEMAAGRPLTRRALNHCHKTAREHYLKDAKELFYQSRSLTAQRKVVESYDSHSGEKNECPENNFSRH